MLRAYRRNNKYQLYSLWLKHKEDENRYSVDDLKCKIIIVITGYRLLTDIHGKDRSILETQPRIIKGLSEQFQQQYVAAILTIKPLCYSSK